jgi:GDPmannose 4,6-dehydratase
LRSKDFFIRKCTNAAARIALGKETELKLGNLNFARDEHFSDLGCYMMWKMLQNDIPRDYVIGNGECHYGEEYLNLIFSYFNLNWKKYVKIDSGLFRPNEVHRLISDPSKAENELGWIKNLIPFDKHISIMCEYDYVTESGDHYIWPEMGGLFSQIEEKQALTNSKNAII